MLAKSQAKKFFLGGTIGFSVIFLGLTVDTLRRVPARSHEDALTQEVLRGRHIWDKNNCMGCHTILGEGAYYAPELTRVVERRGKDWIRLFLRDPAKVFPNQRQMVRYGFHPDQIEDVIAFLEWIQNIDSNGFPAKPDLAPAQVKPAVASAAADGKLGSAPPKFKIVCMSCHRLDGHGATVGPALDNLSARYSRPELDKWLSNPQAVKSGTAMPNPTDLGVSADEKKEIADFLLSNGGPQGGVR